MQAECDAAVEDIVNEGIISNLNDIPVNIDLTNIPYPDKIKKRIRAEFMEVLRLLNFNEKGHDIFRRWYVDGRLYYHKVIDNKDTQRGLTQLRFIDPTNGEICIDGLNIKDISMCDVRALMGIVNQESILFNDTIFNNIAFGLPDATEEDVMKAARVANAHDFIMNLENGYDTNIGERGNKLSGGQKQRMSIARAVLKNP